MVSDQILFIFIFCVFIVFTVIFTVFTGIFTVSTYIFVIFLFIVDPFDSLFTVTCMFGAADSSRRGAQGVVVGRFLGFVIVADGQGFKGL